MEEYCEQEGFEEPGDDERVEEDEAGSADEAGGLEELMEISAVAKERKMKKEQEIFVSGMNRDAVEEDVRNAFETIGEIVEVGCIGAHQLTNTRGLHLRSLRIT
uniref:RRM domain-containing protein n=1 Tax=Nelumbo nucifera TaxID=4432 RepID=A0A822Z759_NELNU|nr:TPA_asm: hypothetical protein HUJ06_014773 [Nelumbo nucifera]